MQKLQDSVFSIVKTTNLSPAVFSFLQPTDDYADKTPLGGIFEDTKHGWLALGPKFCVVDLRTGLKVAARTFGASASNNTIVTSVVELPKPLTENSKQLLISLQCEDIGMICVLHVNGSQILRCMQTEVVVTQLTVCDNIQDGPLTCFDGLVMAGTARGEIFVFDLNRSSLIQALKDISQGYEHLVQNESNPSNLSFLPLNAINRIEEQRELALENDHHLAVLLNESSMIDGQYIFRNPDGTVRMKAKRDHIRVTVLQYIPQVASLAVGFNFGAFQIWNMMTLDLEFTSQVNVECLPVTHFAFQEPCDDPRAFCYLWVVFSVIDRYEEDEFPLAVMYSLTYQGKRMLSETNYLYQDFSTASIRFQIELGSLEDSPLVGGKCIACHSYSIKTTLGDEGEDNMLNICQLVWECWGESENPQMQYGMLLFDLDQWYKDQMPARQQLASGPFQSVSGGAWAAGALHARLVPASLAVYSHPTSLEEHFYPNSLQYNCIFVTTSEALTFHTAGVQRQSIGALASAGPAALLHPERVYTAAVRAGLGPLHPHTESAQEDQRRYLLSVALEARLSQFLKRCANDWAPGTHANVGCTLTFLVDWAWQRAIELKETAKELTAPLFVSSAMPDRNVVRSLEHCVQQLTLLTGLMDSILTKCCNLVVPDALSEMEERQAGISAVSLYFQVVQWFLRVGLLPERATLPYPVHDLTDTYCQRRLKLNRLQENSNPEENAKKSCTLLYIDQLIEHEFGGDRIHQMWIKGGSEIQGLYPPPSLYSLLRLYLLPDIAEEHKHSLVLYLLVDYSMIYDDVRYEAVIRRLMQFPTMFGLSNTAIKATQAFWHLDHRDFDFALDQLQCLTGNTLHDWQHNVVLSSLLAQKKTQAALQYLHVRKPAPLHCKEDGNNFSHRLNDHDKLEEWQSCCNLYLARGLLFEALDVIRMCVLNAKSLADKTHMLNFFFKGCRNSGNLSKLLQVSLLPLEEDVFIKYLENCNESQTSDLLIMYYLQQARYLEAERYNNLLKHTKPRNKDLSTSVESLYDLADREMARDALVEVVCSALPSIACSVARCAMDMSFDTHVHAPKPMSVFVQAKSPKNTFTYKSSFIQDTIENASETWMNKPKMRKGLKRALNIEDTPFICTPKLHRSRSIFTEQQESESTPPKRSRIETTNTPKTPKNFKLSDKLSSQMDKLLEMPEMQSPIHLYKDRADTPHSILKMRSGPRSAASPTLPDDSDDELLETASCHTHYSDSTNKHLRFTIPASESGSGEGSPINAFTYDLPEEALEREPVAMREREMDISTSDSYATTTSHAMNDPNPLESPPKKLATETNIHARKSYKDTVRARRSLSISANSSLSEDPNTSIESIADIPITLINPRYSGEKKKLNKSVTPEKSYEGSYLGDERNKEIEAVEVKSKEDTMDRLEVPRTPRARRGIRSIGESTPLSNRSRSGTPERQDSPAVTPLRGSRAIRSRSKTPELSPRSSPLAPIPEHTSQDADSEPHPIAAPLILTRQRSRSKTPERADRGVSESPRLEVIKESPTKGSGTESSTSSPTRRNLRSRSTTPEVEVAPEPIPKPSPRSLRSRSKTPEKLRSPKKEHSVRTKKSLSRIVLEANTFAKTKQTLESLETEIIESRAEKVESTPMKTLKQVSSLMDVTLSPIVNKSILQSSNDNTLSSEKDPKSSDNSEVGLKTLPAFTTIHETYFEKSVLKSYQSSIADSSIHEKTTEKTTNVLKPLPDFGLNDTDFNKSVLHSYESSVAECSSIQESKDEVPKPFAAFASMIETDFEKSVLNSQTSLAATPEVSQNVNTSSLITNDSDVEMKGTESDTAEQKEKKKIVEIEREINEIEDDMSNDSERASDRTNETGAEDSSEESEESVSTDEESSEESISSEEDENEVISIGDSDSDDSVSEENEPTKVDEIQQNEPREIEQENIVEIEQENIPEMEQENIEQSELTEKVEGSLDPLNQAQVSLMTDDNSAVESDHSISLNYSDEKIEGKGEQQKEPEIQTAVNIQVVVEDFSTKEKKEQNKPIHSMDVVDTLGSVTKEILPVVAVTKSTESEKKDVATKTCNVEQMEIKQTEKTDKPKSTKLEDKTVEKVEPMETDTSNKTAVVEETKTMDTDEPHIEENQSKVKPATRNKRNKSTSSNKSSKDTQVDLKETTNEPKTPITRKRANSKAKEVETVQEPEKAEIEEPKTPATRKRSQSNASKPEEKTPEDTPTRRRAKTPTSTEVRKIITRRVSREMAGKLDESNQSLDESVTLTPKRRTSRAKSKNDDNDSVASESSFVSNASRTSEDVKPRKGKKSVVVSKPELSAIPEVIAEESKESQDSLGEYSGARRLTRNQRAMLESMPSPRTSRRASTASRSSINSDSEEPFHVQTMDRISLLNKTDFDGPPDTDELQTDSISPESIASDASKMRRARMTRAASETKTIVRAAKINRRIASTDVVEQSPVGSPGTDSPVRSRRASFNRACVALNTPKGRRTSTDLRKGETDSPVDSPSSEVEATTPSRRPRRASTQSDSGQAKPDAGKRTKKMSVLPEVTENK